MGEGDSARWIGCDNRDWRARATFSESIRVYTGLSDMKMGGQRRVSRRRRERGPRLLNDRHQLVRKTHNSASQFVPFWRKVSNLR